jgi:hypothetical protein
MFDNNKIIDTVLDDYIVTNNQLYAYHFGSAEPVVANIKKTSYNILDLVEVGDLVEIKDSVYLHRVYEQIYKGLNNQTLSFIYMTIHTTSQYLLSDVNKEVITAIYKRQSNGDYKRYEIYDK